MAEDVRWIIGQGESLVQKITLKTGGGEKAYPYEYDEAVDRLDQEIDLALSQISTLPNLACPNDEAVLAVTLHPSFLAKSYHPTSLLNAIGARQIGSRERRLIPEGFTTRVAPERDLVSAELFVAGPRQALRGLLPSAHRSDIAAFRDDFRKIEHVRVIGPERIMRRGISDGSGKVPLEIVLHGSLPDWRNENVETAFEFWCESLGNGLVPKHVQRAGGLIFLGMHAPADLIEKIAQFSFLRLVRRMPRLSFRDISMDQLQGVGELIDCSSISAVSDQPRVAILDGGVGDNHPFGNLVVPREPLDIGPPDPTAIDHGTKVTSAFLFGSINDVDDLPECFAKIDHWRVFDQNDNGDFDLLVVLDRVMSILSQNRYDLVCLAMGPDEAMLDDDIHPWTARLDEYAAAGQTLIVSAVGNNGAVNPELGLNRIQPSSDGVNVLAVGSRDCMQSGWSRAPYSAVGPGRSPGLVKPDLVAFGGAEKKAPFVAAGSSGVTKAVAGTSYSAPSTARLATGLIAVFEAQLSAMAQKALLIHQADTAGNKQSEVGWGGVCEDLGQLLICREDEATVIYQGMLERTRHMRFPLPMPNGRFQKRTSIKATFVVATPTDPEDAVNYTRAGVGITFRPSTSGHPGFHPDGKERSTHESKSFFGNSHVFKTEQELRGDAHRWEAVLKSEKRFNAGTLNEPVFDVEHLARANGQSAERTDTVPYALIVTVREKGNSQLYNQILRAYGNKLKAFEPRVGIRVRT